MNNVGFRDGGLGEYEESYVARTNNQKATHGVKSSDHCVVMSGIAPERGRGSENYIEISVQLHPLFVIQITPSYLQSHTIPPDRRLCKAV